MQASGASSVGPPVNRRLSSALARCDGGFSLPKPFTGAILTSKLPGIWVDLSQRYDGGRLGTRAAQAGQRGLVGPLSRLGSGRGASSTPVTTLVRLAGSTKSSRIKTKGGEHVG
jgi:hypothetical protein